jgi:hypothetical protein
MEEYYMWELEASLVVTSHHLNKLVLLVGTRDLRTLWSPPVSLNQERDIERRKAVFFFFFFKFIVFEKSPMKTYMGECLIYIKVPLDETKAQALEKNWESKGDPKEPRTHKKNQCSTSR